jgi:hypothetical protein
LDNRFYRLIEALTRHQVRFIVVGGVAAVLHRAPITTQISIWCTIAARKTSHGSWQHCVN